MWGRAAPPISPRSDASCAGGDRGDDDWTRDDYNEDLMTALAEASSAKLLLVKDAEKLPAFFAEELGVARSLLARGITIRITVPDGVRLREIIGRPEIECRGRNVEIRMPELFGAEKRRFLASLRRGGEKAAPLDVAGDRTELRDRRGYRGAGAVADGEREVHR